jgi:UDP-N-acetylmuramoylalanine--D-glutamate ligase
MKTYLVVGLGATGLSILEFLKKSSQVELIAFDTRADLDIQGLREHFPNLVYHLGIIDLKILERVDEVIVSPGVPLDTPVLVAARARGLAIFGDIELFYQHARAPIIGITGTNAKSTVTTLVTEMINAAGQHALSGGNLGVHALKLLDLPVPDYYVLELSSFQLELTRKLSCLVGVVLNVSPDHLDRHEDLYAYQSAKERLYLNCQHPVYFRGMRYQSAPNSLSYTFDEDIPITSRDFGVLMVGQQHYLAQGRMMLMKAAALSQGLQGGHNIINALSALAITAPLHLPLEPQLEVLKNFKGLPHRCVLVRTLNEVRWINDSKGTNVGATRAAIRGIAQHTRGRIILILGGLSKKQDFNLLHQDVADRVAHTIIFGQDKALIAQALKDQSYEFADDLDHVVRLAYLKAEAGDVVLFSPACASQDMFKHYVHRGELFEQLVQELVP